MELTLEDLTPGEVLALAEGLLRRGQFDRARQLYDLAQEQLGPSRNDVAVWRGLAVTPSGRTGSLIKVLDALEANRMSAFASDGLATWMKILPFFEDAKFRRLSQAHADLLPIPNWHWNLQTVLWAVQQASGLEGDFVELGVFRGHTTLFAAEYLDFAASPRTWWLYDTFDGIPDDQLDPGWAGKNQMIYRNTFSYEEVRDRFSHFPNIRVTQGRVPEILHEASPERIAFMHVDLNNSTAEIAALEVLFERLVTGAVVVFDDYCWEASRAQHEAEKAWFAARGLHVLPLPTGQGVFVRS